MYTVKSIMSTDVVTVRQDSPLVDAMRLLADHNVTGLPVVDGGGELVGIVSEKDMMGVLYDDRLHKKTVADVMTRDFVAFDADEEVVRVCEAMVRSTFRRVPILSEGKLVGIVSRRDIIRFTLKLRESDRVDQPA